VIPLSWSLDHVGPLAATVRDAAAVLQAIAGYDPLDVCSVDVPVADYGSPLGDGAKKLRVGIPQEFFYDDLDDEIRAAMEQAITVIGTLVTDVREVGIKVSTDRTVQAAESFAYHARSIAQRPELYQAETLRRIRSGEKVTVVEYIQQRRELDQERRRAKDFFAHVDLLITPTIPIPAPLIADFKRDPAALRPAELALLRNTRPFNVWGLPTISVPCGFTKSGLPIGLQIAGPHWREDLVLRLAHAYEQETEWHKRRCPS
jgi:Asp-tRNA(Asn)/Glu-tRNA(Gln) amidotransferase A subunit family amidase